MDAPDKKMDRLKPVMSPQSRTSREKVPAAVHQEHPLLQLQGTLGNQGVNRLLQTIPNVPRATVAGAKDAGASKEEPTRTAEAVASDVPGFVREVLRSPGRPLDASSRAYFEPRFGQDFGGVQVHTDARAVESARKVHALAYTVGQHLVFGAGQFAPTTCRGRELLAHELG